MGQKVHPVGIRLGNTRRAYSCWYRPKAYYSFFLNEDRHIREFILRTSSLSKQKDISSKITLPIISEIQIDRRFQVVRLRILGSRLDSFAEVEKQEPLSLENIRLNLIQECIRFRRNYFHGNSSPREAIKQNLDFKIYISELEYPEISPQYQASLIVEDLQKRTPFRRAIRSRTVQASRIREILGIRIQISGRLGGAEIARTEWTREGQVPLHTILAHLDYSSQAANTIYGLLGVKVWIFIKKHL